MQLVGRGYCLKYQIVPGSNSGIFISNQEYPFMKYLLLSFICLSCTSIALAQSNEGKTATTQKPFVLIARLHALSNESAEVIRLSQVADEAVKATEPGMLLHTFDQDPNDPLGFVWTEVYADSDALIFHLENPPLQQYLADVSPLLDSFTVELYGDVSQESIEKLRATGTPTIHYRSRFGYIRDLTPQTEQEILALE